MKKRQENNERFAKMGDEKARDNYKEEVEQVDEALPLLAAVPAMLGKSRCSCGKRCSRLVKQVLPLQR